MTPAWSSVSDMPHNVSVRSFWERKVAEADQDADNTVWTSIYGTIRDRRRSRSRASTSSIPRSRTPSSVLSERTTPSPGPPLCRAMSEEILTMSPGGTPRHICSKCKYQTTCWLVPRSVPVYYSSTILIQLGSTKRRYIEEIKFQKRLIPRKFSEGMEVATEPLCRCYTTKVTIPCDAIISLEPHQRITTEL